MEFSPFLFDRETLAPIEQALRACLEQDPSDTATRLHLAWFFVVQAWHVAGQESMVALTGSVPIGNKEQSPESAKRLLQSGLQQAAIVQQISQKPEEQTEVAKLRSLVRLFGGKNMVGGSEEEADRVLELLVQALCSSDVPPASFPDRDGGSNRSLHHLPPPHAASRRQTRRLPE